MPQRVTYLSSTGHVGGMQEQYRVSMAIALTSYRRLRLSSLLALKDKRNMSLSESMPDVKTSVLSSVCLSGGSAAGISPTMHGPSSIKPRRSAREARRYRISTSRPAQLLVNGSCITPVTCVLLGSAWSDKMADDFPSSNPFRRKTPAADIESTPHLTPSRDSLPASAPSFDGSSASVSEPAKLQKKVTKKVRVQSPPPSSPEDISMPHKPPAPIPRDDGLRPGVDDPFDSASDTSETSDDDTTIVTSNYVPANPFQKTLATLEHTEGVDDKGTPAMAAAGQKAGRASMDVDTFKRLLLTGSAGSRDGTSGMAGSAIAGTLPPAVSNLPPTNIVHHIFNDGTSTDTSSISKQSLFEPVQENHPESPRTSHEVSDPDDERRPFGADSSSVKSERMKPPPPSSKYGKLIKVELRDEKSSPWMGAPALLTTKKSQQSLNSLSYTQSQPSPTDLNKPLPAAPPLRTSHESDRESIFDVESAGKKPEPPSPSSSVRRKTPPAPPLTRRHSQLVSDSKLNTMPTGRLSPNFEEPFSYAENAVPLASKAPPPPPSRRPASIRNSSSYDVSITLPSVTSPGSGASIKSPAPAPPPTRTASKRLSGQPPSIHSLDMPIKRHSAVPPPPPPRQRASSRTSMEVPAYSPAPSKSSGEYFRRSLEETRRGSQTSQPDQSEDVETENPSAVGSSNILADLAALQREVDALRGITGKGTDN